MSGEKRFIKCTINLGKISLFSREIFYCKIWFSEEFNLYAASQRPKIVLKNEKPTAGLRKSCLPTKVNAKSYVQLLLLTFLFAVAPVRCKGSELYVVELLTLLNGGTAYYGRSVLFC